MKLLAYILSGETLGVDKTSWEEHEFIGIVFSACTNSTIIPSDYADISTWQNWAKFGQDTGMNYVQVRNEIKALLPADQSFLTEEEKARLVEYNLYKYFKIYDKIADGTTIISSHPPVDIDYDLLGYNKKRVFDKGELMHVIYYENFNQATNVYSGKVVEEIRDYYRINQMLSRREMIINWFLEDGTTGHSKNTVKYYTMLEAIQAGETRRANLISDLKITVIGLIIAASGTTAILAQNAGRPFLDTYAMEISKYVQGFEQQLKTAILVDTTFTWLNLPVPNTGGITVRQYLISELNIDYSINSIYT